MSAAQDTKGGPLVSMTSNHTEERHPSTITPVADACMASGVAAPEQTSCSMHRPLRSLDRSESDEALAANTQSSSSEPSEANMLSSIPLGDDETGARLARRLENLVSKFRGLSDQMKRLESANALIGPTQDSHVLQTLAAPAMAAETTQHFKALADSSGSGQPAASSESIPSLRSSSSDSDVQTSLALDVLTDMNGEECKLVTEPNIYVSDEVEEILGSNEELDAIMVKHDKPLERWWSTKDDPWSPLRLLRGDHMRHLQELQVWLADLDVRLNDEGQVGKPQGAASESTPLREHAATGRDGRSKTSTPSKRRSDPQAPGNSGNGSKKKRRVGRSDDGASPRDGDSGPSDDEDDEPESARPGKDMLPCPFQYDGRSECRKSYEFMSKLM
jgi:hypothetical protein